jgi:NADH dehydrogenase/NADH:ubiquinone oxidoreductase subunit G
MKSITFQMDGKAVTATEGMSLLQAARQAGVEIPTLCFNEELKPSGDCRMCMVEVVKGKRKRLVASCCYPVQEGIVVTTDNPRIKQIRKMIIELVWPTWTQLAEKYGVTKSRFVPEMTDCNLCGQCVRYCAEVVKKNAVFFEGRGVERHVGFTPGMAECDACRKCFAFCTGGYIVTEHGKAKASLEE